MLVWYLRYSSARARRHRLSAEVEAAAVHSRRRACRFRTVHFNVVLCQLGLQLFPDRPAALAEMRRVLAPTGRLLVSVVGPIRRCSRSWRRRCPTECRRPRRSSVSCSPCMTTRRSRRSSGAPASPTPRCARASGSSGSHRRATFSGSTCRAHRWRPERPHRVATRPRRRRDPDVTTWISRRIGRMTDAGRSGLGHPCRHRDDPGPRRGDGHGQVHGRAQRVRRRHRRAAEEAHERDQAIEGEEGVRFERAWLDAEAGKVFCLSTAPSKENVMRVHERAGHPTAEVYELSAEVG